MENILDYLTRSDNDIAILLESALSLNCILNSYDHFTSPCHHGFEH